MIMTSETGTLFLSVIIPVWNRPNEIARSVRSIAVQLDDRNAEIIIVNDASTDNTADVIENLSAEHPIVKVLKLQRHGGAAAARNAGLNAARGIYIWFVDSDDIVNPGAVELIMPELQRHTPDILRFDKQNSIPMAAASPEYFSIAPRVSRSDFGKDAEGLMTCLSMGSVWNAVFSRRVIGDIRFDETFSYGEDALFTWAVALCARECIYIHAPLYSYLETPGSLTSSKTTERFRCYMLQIECFLKLIDCSQLEEKLKKRLYSDCCWRVYSHAFGCFRPSEINSEMWRIWRKTYASVMISNLRRSFPRRLLSGLFFPLLNTYLANAVFMHLLHSRQN